MTALGLRFIFEHPGDCHLSLVREFYVNWLIETKYKTVPIPVKDVKFSTRIVNKFLGTPNCDADDFNRLKENPSYRDIRHTLYGVESTARQNIMKFRNNLRWRFCYGGLITHFLRAEGIEEEAVDLTVAFHPDLTGKIVDVKRTKALDTSHGLILLAQELQFRDDSVMARMFGMAELQLRIGGCHVTDEEMETLADHYPLTDSAAFLCRIGPAFLEPLDDDEATADEAMDEEDDVDVVDEEANALMGFYGGRDDGEA
ncbi:hypothetical protein KY290_021251 [Solanum tuberosum]|uniref:Integrase core domain containing protein n=1 Tax=Solanum tuberosum TaxID=4113 RepID=A0ABQ7V0Y7_SOLTU|nr:hypothetical protein KY290_021251 [Solanum tuberosum]